MFYTQIGTIEDNYRFKQEIFQHEMQIADAKDAARVRLIVDGPARGSWNMAVDRALLESATRGGVATLRVYRWTPATISLGYFQPYEQRRMHKASSHCPVVRRETGGGAILHDDELTYSLVLPACDPLAREHNELFRRVHRSLIETLEACGVRGCEVVEEAMSETRDEPFLCFQRRAAGDVVVDGVKIIGSAQRRRRDALLQHGSILLGQSAATPELPGIAEIREGKYLNAESLLEQWSGVLAREFDWKLERGRLDHDEENRALRAEEKCFASAHWTKKR